MFSRFKYYSTVLALAVICISFNVQAAQSRQQLQDLKQQLNTSVKSLMQLQGDIDTKSQLIKELADKRRFYQIFKTQEEKDLITSRKQDEKASVSGKAQIKNLQDTLRREVSDYLAEQDASYSELRTAVLQLAPVVAQGESAVSQLYTALTQLSSSQSAARINATGSVIGAFTDTKPGLLSDLSEVATQAAVDKALRNGKAGLEAAVAFDSKLQELAKGKSLGILSGSWNGAIGRGVIFALISGRHPLSSNGFNFSNSMFQLSDLKQVKEKVSVALKEIEPVSKQLSSELEDLRAKMTFAENEVIREL